MKQKRLRAIAFYGIAQLNSSTIDGANISVRLSVRLSECFNLKNVFFSYIFFSRIAKKF